MKELLLAQKNMETILNSYSNIIKHMKIPEINLDGLVNVFQNTLVQQNFSSYQLVESYRKALMDSGVWMNVAKINYNHWENVAKSLGMQMKLSDLVREEYQDNLVSVLENIANSWSINIDGWQQKYISNTKLPNVDLLSVVNKTYYEDDEIENFEAEEGFNDNTEIQKAIEEQINDPIGFQEKAYQWTEKKKRQFFIVLFILRFLWANFLQPYFQQQIGVPVTAWTIAQVREVPEKAGAFIGDLRDGIEAVITENVPYYYKVTFIDENGEEKSGYVSKRSVKIVETVVNELETEEVTATTEIDE